jgi:hypothetical protein
LRSREGYVESFPYNQELASSFFHETWTLSGGNKLNKRYLNDGRLHDVIAAIQVLAKWPGPSMRVKNWNDKFGEAHSADKGYDPWVRKLKERPSDGDQYLPWSTIFWEHPEFFRLTEEHVSLKWRRGLEVWQECRDFPLG